MAGSAIAVAAITAIALAFRIVGIDQSLFGDEDFTYYIVVRDGLGEVWDAVYDTSITPPLHYVITWASLKFGGDSTVVVRMPSLVLGTALVPLLYLLGRRVAGDRAGLLAAALIALSPFAIWYSDEARAYTTMMLLVALSTLALLLALDGGRRRWWILYALCSCAALWTHYTAVFVIAAQAVWALWAHRESWRPVLLAQAAVAAGFLPWLPGFLQQRRNEEGVAVIELFGEASIGALLKLPVRTLVGHPEVGLRDFPGVKGAILLVLVAAGALAVVAGVERGSSLARQARRLLRSEPGLILLLAVATPLGLLVYAAVGSSLFLPRNFAASLPAVALVVAMLLDRALERLPSRAAVAAAVGALLVVLALNAVESLDDSRRRPPYREATRWADQRAAAGVSLVEVPLPLPRDERLPSTTLDRYLDGDRPVRRSESKRPWRDVAAGGSAYQVRPRLLRPSELVRVQLWSGETAPADLFRRLDMVGGFDGRARVSGIRVFEGLVPIEVARYEGLVRGRLDRGVISWSLGSPATVARGRVEGLVESFSPAGSLVSATGWTLDPDTGHPADWVLLFSGDRLVAATAGGVRRAAIARAEDAATPLIGFALGSPPRPLDASRLRVFAIVGDEATELPVADDARP